ncbi:phosphatase PAP2 family protein [Haladaptatus cibarius]|uniref:phosphatase PAP2 family protein n=1 Tax=Haladaptatus cibarius TaxID=453847 RepID=UPI00067880D1|nr:phosphatase PAP2 family protein [Haladaptatus cibarius]
MSRGWGIIEAFREVLPGWAPELFTYVTQLGDVWLLFVVGALCYWFNDDRERFAFVLAVTLGALALTLALKEFFALARPNETLRIVDSSGYGFPSGHAIGSTVFWGVLALAVDRWNRGIRIAGAAVIVTLVILSRIIIGVHFAIDVIVGVAVGLAYLAFVVKGLRWRPTPAFGLAVVIALVAVLLALQPPTTDHGMLDAVAALGGTVGALLLWWGVGPPDGSVTPIAGAAGLVALGVLSYVGLELSIPLVAVFVVNAVVQAGVVAYPRIAGQ